MQCCRDTWNASRIHTTRSISRNPFRVSLFFPIAVFTRFDTAQRLTISTARNHFLTIADGAIRESLKKNDDPAVFSLFLPHFDRY
jgi:hypothetical protein